MLVPALVALVAGAVVWRAGTALSRDADALAASTPLGRAFVGVVLLGVATSLPEVATTVTAGALGNPQLATGNLMGGVALQVVVLAVADLASRRSVTLDIDNAMLLVQHVVLLLLLSVAIGGMAVGEPFALLGVGFWPVLLALVYSAGVVLVFRGGGATRWAAIGGSQRRAEDDGEDRGEDVPARPPTWRIGASCLLILVAGYALARSADRLSETGPFNATFLGAVLVAVATSLPELSTVLGSIRAGAYDLAVSNIVGTNCLEVALLLVADVALRQGPLMSFATPSDIFLAALAAVLTCLYLGGLLLRHQRTVAGAGADSVAVVVVYVLGLVLLAVT